MRAARGFTLLVAALILFAVPAARAETIAENDSTGTANGEPVPIGPAPGGWMLAYQHDANGVRVAGDLAVLSEAVRAGADVKVAYALNDPFDGWEGVFECEWLFVKQDDSVVTCVNTHCIGVGGLEGPSFGFNHDAYHFFALVNTEGRWDQSRWLVGEHTDRGHTQVRRGFKWFVKSR
jgi:hypothetical protein